MKKIYNILLFGLASILALSSCDDPNYINGGSEDGKGELSTASLQISLLNVEKVIESRGGEDVLGFTINIKKKSDASIVQTYLYSKMPEIVTLPIGEYSIEAYNSEVKDAEWDSPYYYATEDFTITKDEITEVEPLTCKLANVKVTVGYTDELKALIGEGKDVNVNVSVGGNETLDFAYGETRAGFFKVVPSSNTLVASFAGTVEGVYVSEYKVVTDIEAGQHRIITFGIKNTPALPDEYGTIGTTGIGLDSKVTTVDLTADVPGFEDPVDPDDMLKVSSNSISFSAKASSKDIKVTATADWTVTSDQSWCTLSATSGSKGETTIKVSAAENEVTESRTATLTLTMGNLSQEIKVTQAAKGDDTAPTITSTTLNLEGVNVITDGMTATVNILAPKGIAHLRVTIDSESLTPADLEDVGLAGSFDLAEPGELAQPLTNLGFPVGDDVVGKTELLFDISKFMGLLNTFKGDHKFILDVEDAAGQKVGATLKFLAQ